EQAVAEGADEGAVALVDDDRVLGAQRGLAAIEQVDPVLRVHRDPDDIRMAPARRELLPALHDFVARIARPDEHGRSPLGANTGWPAVRGGRTETSASQARGRYRQRPQARYWWSGLSLAQRDDRAHGGVATPRPRRGPRPRCAALPRPLPA